MTLQQQIEAYLSSLPEQKANDVAALHAHIMSALPDVRLWFLDGKNVNGKVVSNPNIGYGLRTMRYADGSSREFYQVGISANTSGISLYLMGFEDRNFLKQTVGARIGKATVTGYCIKFKRLDDVHIDVVDEIVRTCFALDAT